MAAYNAEAHLRTAVESILNQTFTDWELIVVNDGSTDSTADILSQYAAQDSRVRVAGQANAGLAATRNTAIAQSRADFIAIMDSDDIAHPNRLEMQRDFLLENPDCAAVSCRCDLIDERGALISTQSPRKPFHPPGMPLDELLPEQAWVNQTAMLRVESLERGEIYRQWFRVLEDFDFSLRVSDRHKTAYLNDPPLYQYRQYPTQAANLMNTNPVLCWHYWCAAALSAHCRRSGAADPIEGLGGSDVASSFLPALAALPSPVKAACIKKARHWCRRLLQQGGSGGAEQIIGELTALATERGDLLMLRRVLVGVMFYALRAGQWRLNARLAGRLFASFRSQL